MHPLARFARLASALVLAAPLAGCTDDGGAAGKMDSAKPPVQTGGAMEKGKMEGAMEKGKMEGAMDKGKMEGAMDQGKMEGAMGKSKMEPAPK